MNWAKRIYRLAKKLRDRWHAPLRHGLVVQSDRLSDVSRKLDAVAKKLDTLTQELSAAKAESEERRAAMERAVIDALEQHLSRRLAEQASDLQHHLQLHAASIVAHVSESAAAHGEADATILPFSRAPMSARAA